MQYKAGQKFKIGETIFTITAVHGEEVYYVNERGTYLHNSDKDWLNNRAREVSSNAN